MPAMQALANGVPYTLTLSVFRKDSGTNVVTVSVTGGAIAGSYSWQSSRHTRSDSVDLRRIHGRPFQAFASEDFAQARWSSQFPGALFPAIPVITAQPFPLFHGYDLPDGGHRGAGHDERCSERLKPHLPVEQGRSTHRRCDRCLAYAHQSPADRRRLRTASP